ASSVEIITTRVKIFLVNSKDEILIATSGGGCQLPGGHIEEGEGILQGIVREVQEETGIILDYDEILGQFYIIKYLQKNYQNTDKNRLSQVIYFLAKTDKQTNIANLNITENEKINNFDIKYIKFTNFDDFVKQFIAPNQKEINLVIAKEMLKVYPYLVKIVS
ncbi:MAG: NUDIX hydrolase, partial [Clostridia bacterium]|nr:NUDIX hydrolase [Clostridia bacterium]